MGNQIELANQEIKNVALQYLQQMGLKVDDKQGKTFIELCSMMSLNPFKREVYAIPYGGSFSIIVGYEVYIKRAERTGKLSGWKAWCEGEGANLKGCIEIYRKDFNQVFYHEVDFSEYSTGQNLWKTKPKTMIKKVAIAQGFRMCFSDDLGGMPYTHEEMDYSEVEVKVEPKVEPKIEPKSQSKDLCNRLEALGLDKGLIRAFGEKHQLSSKPEIVASFLENEEELKKCVNVFMAEYLEQD